MGFMHINDEGLLGDVTSLPVGLPETSVLGATRVFDSRVPVGNAGDAVPIWWDAQGSGTALTTAASAMTGATAPTLSTDGDGTYYVRFTKASSQALGQVLQRSTPHTVVTVARWRAAASSLEAVTSGGGGNTLQANATNAAFRSYSGTSLDVVSPIGIGWHVFITVFNGASSIARLDNLEERTGNVGANIAPQLTVGGWNGTTYSGVDVLKVAYYPRALTAAERTTRVAELQKEYPGLL